MDEINPSLSAKVKKQSPVILIGDFAFHAICIIFALDFIKYYLSREYNKI